MPRTRKVKRSARSKKSTKSKARRRTPKKQMKFEVKSSVARDISAVIYFVFATITFLSIQGSFGIIGEIWVGILQPILGWGIYMVPPLFLLITLMLFFARNINFGLSKVVGLILLVLSVLSIAHLAVPIESLLTVAQQGQYGGYVGFVTNFFMREVLSIGNIGSAVIFVAAVLISILLSFEISLVELAKFFKPEIKIEKKPDEKRKRKEEQINSDNVELASDEVLKAIYGERDSSIRIKRAQPVNETNEDSEKEPEARSENNSGNKKVEIKDKAKEEDIPEDAGKEKEQDFSDWEFPSLDLLNSSTTEIESDDDVLMKNAEKIRKKLGQFGIDVTMHEVHVGPTVIQYTLKPHEGVKLSKITALKNDLALALAASSVRIEAPISGKALVGIEVPNEQRSMVRLREILESQDFKKIDSNLKFPLGRDVSGEPIVSDLRSMPHLLIAGATGSGKSVGMNTLLISLLYQNSPLDLKMILIDPKQVELKSYNSIPHLLTPVINDPEKAAIALRWCVSEMNRRYTDCADRGKRNITDYNADPSIEEKMSNIVVVIDELADLMMAAGKEVEASICRIAQMARAVGIHLIIATQRPSVDVITGLIKANIPARIAFAVSSSIDSRTIVDSIGAEDLLGKGDMLYLPNGMNKPMRIQGIYISSEEIEAVTNRVKLTVEPEYDDEIVSTKVAGQKLTGVPDSNFGDSDDDMYTQAIEVIKENRKASASLLQRRLKVGYARAARLLDELEENGAIGPSNGAKPREIYLD